ncbi:MAG: hypothetical protein JRN66_08630 [Nitrososphaerota archaeon]|nr:hypothetical protein [Nitrososphaerota archaeon]
MPTLIRPGVSAIIAVLLIIVIVLVAGGALFLDGMNIVGINSSKGSATISSSWMSGSGVEPVWQAEISNIGNTPITGITAACLASSCGGFPSGGVTTWYYGVSPGGSAGTTPIPPGGTAYQSDAVTCSSGTTYQFQFTVQFSNGSTETILQAVTCA